MVVQLIKCSIVCTCTISYMACWNLYALVSLSGPGNNCNCLLILARLRNTERTRPRLENVHSAWLISKGAEHIGLDFESRSRASGCGDSHRMTAKTQLSGSCDMWDGRKMPEPWPNPDIFTNIWREAVNAVPASVPRKRTKSRREDDEDLVFKATNDRVPSAVRWDQAP